MDINDDVVANYSLHKDVVFINLEIEYILTGGQFGIEPGYVVMAVKVLK